MSKSIKLTQEQWNALQSGESITINPPKPEQWEPEEESWVVNIDNLAVYVGKLGVCSQAGRKRATKKLAQRAAGASRSRDRLEAFRDQYWPDWKDYGGEVWMVARTLRYGYGAICHRSTRTTGTVYGPKEFAEKAVKMLNEGTLVL